MINTSKGTKREGHWLFSPPRQHFRFTSAISLCSTEDVLVLVLSASPSPHGGLLVSLHKSTHHQFPTELQDWSLKFLQLPDTCWW